RLRTDAPEHPLGELIRRERRQLLVEGEHEDVFDPGVGEELEPPFERCEELDAAAQHGPRMRIEGHDARPRSSSPCRVDHAEMAPVDAIKGPDGNGAPCVRKSRRDTSNVHAPGAARAASTRSRTSASARSRSAANASGPTASSTEKGPTSVRRSVTQCPPSAIARDRTYVPELTWMSSVTLPPVYAITSSARTVDR